MTFEAWLTKQKKRNDVIGILACDFLTAKKYYGDKKCDHETLYKWDAVKEAYAALDKALNEYDKERANK